MKKIISLFLFAALSLGCSTSSTSSSILLGDKAPFTKFTLLNGSYRTTDNYKGKYLAILFWATTCSRSSSTLEDMADWSKKPNNKNNLRYVSVNVDKASKEDRVREVLSDIGQSSIEHAFSGNDIYDEAYMAYDIGELPSLILIDPKGKVVASGNSVDILEDAFSKK